MRSGELGFVVLTALLLVMVVWWPVRPGLRLRVTQGLTAVTAVVLVLHIFLEFPRFLLLPAGVVFAVLVVVTWRRATRLDVERGSGKRWASVLRRSAASLVGLALVAASGVAAWALPVFELPAPSGPYVVGARSEVFLDENRPEPRVTTSTVPRTVPATIWYPAQKADGQTPLGYDPEIAEALSSNVNVPGVIFDHLRRISTHTFQDAPPAAGRFPVLLYSPGFGSTRYENMALVTELVSHGYVVVGMDHAGTSAITSTQTGEKIPANDQWQLATDETEPTRLIEERAQDARLVLDSLLDTPLAESMDFERVGMFGFSFGGATAAEVLRTDPRVQTALNLDGTFFGKVKQEGVAKPLLRLHHDFALTASKEGLGDTELEPEDEELVRRLSGTHYHAATVKNTEHLSINDTFAVVPVMGRGLLPHARSVEVLRPHVRDWFDHHLQGTPLQLVGRNTPTYPEVVWEN